MRRQEDTQDPQRPPHLDLLGARPRPVPEDLAARVRDAVTEDRGLLARLRALPTRGREALAAVVVLALSVAVLLATPRHDLSGYPGFRMSLVLGALAVLGLIALRASLRPLHRPSLSPRRRTALALAALATPLVLAVLPDVYSGAALHAQVTSSVLDAAWRCLVFGVVVGAPFLLAALLLDRSGLRLRPHFLFAGAAAALTGNFALQLHCPITDPLHLVLGHASVVLPFLVLEAFVRRRA